jgi:hypothetical protein
MNGFKKHVFGNLVLAKTEDFGQHLAIQKMKFISSIVLNIFVKIKKF